MAETEGMHNRSLMDAVQGPIKAYPLRIHSFPSSASRADSDFLARV
jgi:hypothetical protein